MASYNWTQDVKLEADEVDEKTLPTDYYYYTNLLKNKQEDNCMVQINGISRYVHASVFNEAFARIAATQQALSPSSDFTVIAESNYYKYTPSHPNTDEFFLKFKSEADAYYVLGLEKIHIFVDHSGRIVQFTKPTQNTATRAAYRRITAIKARLPKINEEYASIGAIRTDAGKPRLPLNFHNKAWFMQEEHIPAIQRKRKAGEQLDAHEMGLLKNTVLVETEELNARIDVLYNEESDAWLSIRMYQLAGLKFSML